MSINLPTVNLSTAIVGTEFTVSLQDVGIPQDFVNSPLPITIRFYNDSCMGMEAVTQKSGKQFYVSQGQWPDIKMPANETGINFVCTSQMLPVPSVCQLKPVYYGPGEEVDDIGVHGNTPTNLGGSGLSVTTLSNEGNPINTLFIDAGPAGNLNVIQIFNDHFVWSVVQSGVAHQVLKGQISGNPLQIGQAGDISDVLGNLGLPNNIALRIKDSGGSYHDALLVNSLNELTLLAGTANKINFQTNAGLGIFAMTATGITLQTGTITLLAGSLARKTSNTATSCGSGTVISHGLGTTPTGLTATVNIAQPGSANTGIGSIGATTFTATIGAGSTISWIAMA